MITLKIDVDEKLLGRYDSEFLKSFLKEQLKKLQNSDSLQEMVHLSESTLDFWHNKIDDEAWNDL